MAGRRKFLKQLGASVIAGSAISMEGNASGPYVEQRRLLVEKKTMAADRINIACIGMGIMGQRNVKTALQVPGVELVAVCDLYKGRLERSRELFGKDIHITQDYQEGY
jgi:predicted homoserine dehydrogenase-like protein